MHINEANGNGYVISRAKNSGRVIMKKSTGKKRVMFSCAALLWGGGMVAATLWDLPLDEWLYNPSNTFALLMEVVGWWPVLLGPLLLCLYYATGPGGKNARSRRSMGVLFGAALTLAMFGYSYRRLSIRGWANGIEDVRTWLWLGGVLLLAALLGLAVKKAEPPTRRRVRFVGLVGTVLAAENFVIITAIKLVWQRTRFDMLVQAGSYAHFTPWYRPFAYGGDSFPSGHVADTVSLLVLVALCDVWPRLAKYRNWVYVFAWAYIGAMAYSRMVVGAHFLSDVLVGAGLMALLFFHLRRQAFYQKARARAMPDEGDSPE